MYGAHLFLVVSITIIYTIYVYKNDNIKLSDKAINLGRILCALYGFLSTNYVLLPTYERLEGIKDNLTSLGISRRVYWLGNFISDMILFLISLSFLLITAFSI